VPSPEQPQQLKPVHPGHFFVDNHTRRVWQLLFRQQLAAAAVGVHNETFQSESELKRITYRMIVIDNQHYMRSIGHQLDYSLPCPPLNWQASRNMRARPPGALIQRNFRKDLEEGDQFFHCDPLDAADLATKAMRSSPDKLVAPILIIRLARCTSTVRALIFRS
jgi:hypothetical protein